MKFGIFDHLERRADVDLVEQYEDRMRLLELAETAGFYGYHVAEHHHSPLCLAPNQAVYLASVAQRTKRLRFGPLVYVLPLHHPIRLIEEIAMVDQLSGGRYQVGIGPGTGGGTEYAMWGGDAAENAERFEETLEVLSRGLQSEFLTHHGKHFDYQDLWMELRPVQQPHPPFWWAGHAETAARRGANFIGTGSIRGLTQTMATYLETREDVPPTDLHGVTPPAEPLYGGMKHVFVADTDEQARERALTAYAAHRSHYAKPTRSGAPIDAAPRSAANEGPRRGPTGFDPQQALDLEIVVAGSPATVRDFAVRYRDVGANYFVAGIHWGDLTHDEAVHSLELFTSEVMPAFDEP